MKGSVPDLVDRLVRLWDERWRRRHRIRELTDDVRCIFRLQPTRTRRETRLADGTVLSAGDPVGALHLASDRLPHPRDGSLDVTWAKQLAPRIVRSLRLLADLATQDPGVVPLRAFGNDFVMPYRARAFGAIERMGFEVLEPSAPSGLPSRGALLAARLWTILLRRAYNRPSLVGLRLRDFEVRPVWISRRRLLELYGPVAVMRSSRPSDPRSR